MATSQPTRLPFSRQHRIKQGRDFSRVKARGARIVQGCLIANYAVLPPGSVSRLGVVTSRKLGGAVVRNRARRLLRESYRLHQHELERSVDLVLVARASIVRRTLSEVEVDYLRALKRAGLRAVVD